MIGNIAILCLQANGPQFEKLPVFIEFTLLNSYRSIVCKKQTKKLIPDSKKVVWDELISFDSNNALDQIQVTCYDAKNHIIGGLNIHVHHLPINCSTEKYYQLTGGDVLLLNIKYTLFGEQLQPSPSVGNTYESSKKTRKFVDYFVIIGPSESKSGLEKSRGAILSQLPESRDDVIIPPSFHLFAVPCGFSPVSKSSPPRLFSFCVSSKTSLLYCCSLLFWSKRGDFFYPYSVCFISRLPFYSSMLSSLAVLYHYYSLGVNSSISYEQALVFLLEEVPVPIPGLIDVDFLFETVPLRLSLPAQTFDLPILDFSLTQFFSLFDINLILDAMCCILCERKLVVTSSQLSLLNLVCECLRILCFPFEWPHPFIPVLPIELSGVVDSIVPFIIGLPSDCQFSYDSLPDIVVLDIDSGTLCSKNSIPSFPEKHARSLIDNIRPMLFSLLANSDSVSQHINHKSLPCKQREVRLEFLRFFGRLLEGYRSFLFFSEGNHPFFNTAAFLRDRSQDSPFFSHFLPSQIWSLFLHAHVLSPSFFDDILLYTFEPLQETQKFAVHLPSSKLASNSKWPYWGALPDPRNIEIDLPSTTVIRSPSMSFKALSPSLREKSGRERRKQSLSPQVDRLSICLTKLLADITVDLGEVSAVGELLCIKHWRKALIVGLRSSASIHNMSPSCFELLFVLFDIALDNCLQQKDFEDANTFLDFSSRFVSDKQQTLRNRLARHKIFQQTSFWEHVAQFQIQNEEEPVDVIQKEQLLFQVIGSVSATALDMGCTQCDDLVKSLCSRFFVEADQTRSLLTFIRQLSESTKLTTFHSTELFIPVAMEKKMSAYPKSE